MIVDTAMNILTVNNKKEEKILRQRPADFDFEKHTKKETNDLIKQMRETMTEANGIGLAANQIGLDIQIFVAYIPQKYADRTQTNAEKSPRESASSPRGSASEKFYAIFNPKIIKSSEKKTALDEGCLSVPGGYYGDVLRPEKITLVGQDKNGKKIKIKAWGLLARVFQHEVDHLNGILFIDKCKNLKKVVRN